MAYLVDPMDEENKKKEGMNTSGVIGSSVTSSGSAGAPAVDTKAPTSSGFVGLQQYLDANKNQGAGMASEMTKSLVSEADAFKGDAASKALEANEKIAEAARKASASASQIGAGLINDTKDHYAQQGGPDYFGQARDFLSSSYTGPKAEEFTGSLKVSSDKVKDKLGNVGDAASQEDLLRTAYGQNGNYSKGFSMLDSFLINGSEGGRAVVDSTKAKASDISKSYEDAASRINSAMADAQAKHEASKSEVKNSAKALKSNILSRGENAAANLNKSFNPAFLGSAKASIGDGLTTKNVDDIQAIDALIGDAFDPEKYRKTFAMGRIPVSPPAPSEVVAGEAAVTPASAASSGSPSIIDQVNRQGVGAINSIVNAPENIANEAKKVPEPTPVFKLPTVSDAVPKTPSAPTVQIPTLKTVNNTVTSGKKQLKKWGI